MPSTLSVFGVMALVSLFHLACYRNGGSRPRWPADRVRQAQLESSFDLAVPDSACRLIAKSRFYLDFAENQVLFDDGAINGEELKRLLSSPQSEAQASDLLRVLNTVPLAAEAAGSHEFRRFLHGNAGNPAASVVAFKYELGSTTSGADADIDKLKLAVEHIRHGSPEDAWQQLPFGSAVELPYLALTEKIEAAQYRKLLLHEQFAPLAIEAAAFSPHSQYYWEQIKKAMNHSSMSESLLLVETYIRCIGLLESEEGGRSLLDAAMRMAPHFVDSRGRTVYVSSTCGRDPGGTICGAVGEARDMLRLKAARWRAADLSAFVEEEVFLWVSARRKAWVVVWLDPGLFEPLLAVLRESDDTIVDMRMGSKQHYRRKLMREVVNYAARFPHPLLRVEKTPKMLDSGRASEVLNGLYVLQYSASDEHIPTLRRLAADRRRIRWLNHLGKTLRGRLVSYWALGCIGNIHSPKSVACLRELVEGGQLDKRGVETASGFLARSERLMEKRHPDSPRNGP